MFPASSGSMDGSAETSSVPAMGPENGTAAVVSGIAARLRKVQNGFVRSYALTMVLGGVVVGAVIALGRLG